MGYRGKTVEQARARELRALGWTYDEIAAELHVSKSSVSLWCRHVAIDAEAWGARRLANRNFGARNRPPNRLQVAKAAQIEECRRTASWLIGDLSTRDRFIAGVALYAGEGAKTDGAVKFANTDPRMIRFFVEWFREFFDVDESRLRMRLYLHEGLDLEAATSHWSRTTGIPESQFLKSYRAVADVGIRTSKHPMGCPSVSYSCRKTLRTILALQAALLS